MSAAKPRTVTGPDSIELPAGLVQVILDYLLRQPCGEVMDYVLAIHDVVSKAAIPPLPPGEGE